MFLIRMVGREMRAAWKRLLFFFLCVAVGVGAIAAMRSVIQNVRGALAREARTLAGADIVLQTGRRWEPKARATIDRVLAGVPGARRADVVETATMTRPDTPSAGGASLSRMVELKAVDAEFPFYGRILLQDGRAYTSALLANGGALVRPELLGQLGLAVGDRIVIGSQRFEIRGVLAAEPGRGMGMFSLGPRVLIDHADLAKTGLLTFGSRARFQLLLRIPDDRIEGLVKTFRTEFRNDFVSARSYRDTEERVGRELRTAENYLSLVGYVIVVLGGIGVWSVTRVFIQQKIRTIAVLKCLGGSAGRILSIYVAQVMLLSALGSLLGLALAAAAMFLIPANAFANFGVVAYGLTLSACLQALGIGLLVSLLFALVPLLEIRRVKPLLLLRDETTAGPENPGARRWRDRLASLDWLRIGVSVGVAVALALLAGWQAASWRIGAIVSGGFVAVAIVLFLAGGALVWAVRPLRHVKWFPLRHAIIGFGRPGHQTRVILLAVGLGSFFIMGVRFLEANLAREFSFDLRPDAPDMFLIDIQQDQRAGVEAILRGAGSDAAPRLVPVLRARVVGVHGRELNLESVEAVRENGSISREFVVTWRSELAPNEDLIEGQFWGGEASDVAEVSIESGLRTRAGLQLGDRMRFDVLGRIVEAKVTSIREVDWDDARQGGFMFVFRPGVLERAPHTYLAIVRGPQEAGARARLQRDLVTGYANVSVIDVREVVQTIQGVLRNVTLAISIVGGIALFCGLLILVGAVAMTKFQRLQEVALLKTLGATSRTIAAMLLIEYGVLGLLAGVIGAAGALVLSYVFTLEIIDVPWDATPLTALAGIAATTAIVAAVGVLASWDVLRRKPLAVLRAG